MGAAKLPRVKLMCLTCIASFIDFSRRTFCCPKCGSLNIRASGVTRAIDDSEEAKAAALKEFEERFKNE